MATATKDVKPHKPLPAPNSDFYDFASDLPAEELAIVKKVRTYKELGIAGVGLNGYGCPGGSPLLSGLLAMEIARTDVSFCTFHGVHTSLAMNSIYLNGTEEQKQKWLPPMARMEKVGCFGLT